LLEFIIYSIAIIFFVTSVATNIVLFAKNKKLQELSINLALEKFTIGKKLETVIAQSEAKKLEKDDGFLRFISESRDWAFKYIEDVQQAIKDYKENKNKKTLDNLLNFLPKDEDKK
jgi:hypothetical protein